MTKLCVIHEFYYLADRVLVGDILDLKILDLWHKTNVLQDDISTCRLIFATLLFQKRQCRAIHNYELKCYCVISNGCIDRPYRCHHYVSLFHQNAYYETWKNVKHETYTWLFCFNAITVYTLTGILQKVAIIYSYRQHRLSKPYLNIASGMNSTQDRVDDKCKYPR